MDTKPDPVLDAETLALIAGAIDAEPLNAEAQARIKRRLLRRVAADNNPRHVTVNPGDGDWQPFGRGVQIKVMHRTDTTMSYLLKLEAGATLAAHRHPMDEQCVVLEGEMIIGETRIQAGGFHLGRSGVLHDRLHTETGALIFLHGAPPEVATVL